jgi:hypothetical protein
VAKENKKVASIPHVKKNSILNKKKPHLEKKNNQVANFDCYVKLLEGLKKFFDFKKIKLQ